MNDRDNDVMDEFSDASLSQRTGDGQASMLEETRGPKRSGPQPEGGPATATCPTEDEPPAALYFLTNRMNLNVVLSSRLIAPRDSYTKYYADLLALTQGWVPLLVEPPSRTLLEAVTGESGSGNPVIVEFPISGVKAGVAEKPVTYVPAVALSKAVAIHFPTNRDLLEHKARAYGNVHGHDDLLRVTPELFAGDELGSAVVGVPSAARLLNWSRVDRIRGAMSAAVASADTGEQLAVAAAFLGHEDLLASMSMPDWPSKFAIDDHDEKQARSSSGTQLADLIVFRAAYDVFGMKDPSKEWSPTVVLKELAEQVRTAGLSGRDSITMERNLQRVREIVNVEADFAPFRATADALVSAKALLLVLLRPDLQDLLAWAQEKTGADDLTKVAAALLAGRLRGIAREATSVRSVIFDDLTAAWAVRLAHGEIGGLGSVHFTATGQGTSLVVEGVEVAVSGPLTLGG